MENMNFNPNFTLYKEDEEFKTDQTFKDKTQNCKTSRGIFMTLS